MQKIDYIELIEQLNILKTDKTRKKTRTAAADWVRARLEQELDGELAALGLTEELQQAFLAGEEDALAAAAKIILEGLSLSREERETFSRNLKNMDYAAALDRIHTYLRKKKYTAFQKKAALKAVTWGRFLRSEFMPDQDTQDKILMALNLSWPEAEAAEFRSLVIKSEFPINDALIHDLKEHLKPNFSHIDDKGEYIIYETLKFIEHAFLSEKILRPFGINKDRLQANNAPAGDRKKTESNTSQASLLKILIGLKLYEPEATRFLGHVDSGFYLYRDLVVLSCIKCDIYTKYGKEYIYAFIEILAHFARDEKSRLPLYPDLYGPYYK